MANVNTETWFIQKAMRVRGRLLTRYNAADRAGDIEEANRLHALVLRAHEVSAKRAGRIATDLISKLGLGQ